jgi:tetratricopeptide (TPR) repeat protein
MIAPLPEWLAGASSLADLLKLAHQRQQEKVPLLIWTRCALAGEWNTALYDRLAEGIPGAPPASEFSELPSVISAGSHFTLADGIRESYLKQWKAGDPEMQKTAAILTAFYRENGDESQRLRYLTLADPEAAKTEIEALYRRADRGFDLGRCSALLRPLREQFLLLEPSLQAFHNEREQYLQSREIFSDDYYRSTVYLPRQQMEGDCEKLLAAGGPWMLNLFGLGGLGKTMFVRRLIAYRCVPEFQSERTPVGRVDLDFVNLDFLAENAWLVLLEAARQLRPQMEGSPFATLLGREDLSLARAVRSKAWPLTDPDLALATLSSVKRRERIEDLFVRGIGHRRALLVIDTIEEFLLHRPAALQTLLEVLVSVRRRCPEFRVLLSGRYWILDPERKPPPVSGNLRDELAASTIAVPITAFTSEESRHYLREVRHLGNAAVVDAIVKRSDNPFELSLFADLATSRPLLTVEAVEQCPDAKIAYLIERVIDRMPDEPFLDSDPREVFERKRTQRGARWLVRYAVIPQELTLDFVKDVLRRFLEDEMSGEGRRDRTNTPGYEDQPRWQREPGSRIELDDRAIEQIWDELVKYAASYNWVEGDSNAVQLHAEVVTPMRELLRAQPEEYPIYSALHQAAAEYFESRPNLSGKLLAKALYHRFQQDGSAAGKYWREYRATAREISAAAVRDLAKSVLNTKDYLDDDREPLRHYRSGLLIDRETLSDVALEYAHAALLAWLRTLAQSSQNAAANAVRFGRAEWKRFGGIEGVSTRERLFLLDTAEEFFQGNGQRVIELLSESSIATLPPEDQVAARMLLMRVLRAGTVEADRQYDAVAASAPRNLPAFPEHFLLALHAQYILRRDSLHALREFDRAMQLLMDRSDDPNEAGMILQWFGDLAMTNGEYTSLARWSEKMIALPARFPFPAREQACDWLVPAYLELRRFDDAAKAAERNVIEAEKSRLKAMVALGRLQIKDGLALHEQARQKFKDAGYESSSVGEHLELVEAYLMLGNISLAKSMLGGVTEMNESVHALNAMMLRMRLAGAEENAGEARRLLDETVVKLPGWSLSPVAEATARASFLASGAGNAEDAVQFLDRLSALPSPASRYASLRPFVNARLERPLPVNGFHTAVEEPPESPDWFSHNLAFAAACRFFEDHHRLESAIRKGLEHASDQVQTYAVRNLIPSWLAATCPMPQNYLHAWQEMGEAYRPMAMVAHLHEGELAYYGDRRELARSCLAYFRENEASLPGPHLWKLRALMLEGLLALDEGRKDDAAESVRTMVSMASDMGNLAWGSLLNIVNVAQTSMLQDVGRLIRRPLSVSMPDERAGEGPEIVLNLSAQGLLVEFHPVSGGPRATVASTPVAWELAGAPSDLYPASLAAGLQQLRDFSFLNPELKQILFPSIDPEPGRIGLRVPLSSASAVPWELASPPAAEGGIYRAPLSPIALHTFPEHLPDPPVIMGVQLDFEMERYSKRGSGLTGIQLNEFYERAGLRFVSVPIEGKAIYEGLKLYHPAAIHISCGLRDMTTPTDVFLDPGAAGSIEIRPDTLASALQAIPPDIRPFIILDVYWDPEDHVRQTMLRNRFAAGLVQILSLRGVLAIGDYPPSDAAQPLIVLTQQLAERVSMWQLFQTLRIETHPLLPPALFTSTPDLPVF